VAGLLAEGLAMMKYLLRIPPLRVEALPQRRCKECGAERVSIHARGIRKTRDLKEGFVKSIRMRCEVCGKTFSVLPEGQALRRKRSERAIACGVMLYCLGLSYLKVVAFLLVLGIPVAVGTVYGDCLRSAKKASRLNKTVVKGVRVIGVDGTGQKVKGKGSTGVMMGVDLEKGVVLEVELISEEDPEKVKEFIEGLITRYGVEVLVTDEHRSYEGIEERLGKEVLHHRCKAHFLRAKLARLRELRTQMQSRHWWRKLKLLERLEELLRTGPLDEGELKALYRPFLQYRSPGVGKKYGLGYKAKLLLQELLEKIDQIGSWTNNTTERLIGLSLKFRSKTMRGFKKEANIPKLANLLFWMWHNRQDCDLALVV
jgi:transposase-like protein